MWKFSSENSYPDIILHDGVVTKITLDNDDLVMEFNDGGFWIGQDNKQNPYKKTVRTEKSELRFTDFDIDDIYIFKMYNLFKKFYHTSRVEVSLEKLISNVNSGKWTFEFLYEYYTSSRQREAIFKGCVNVVNKQKHYDCQIELDCSKMIYSWNKIDEDAIW